MRRENKRILVGVLILAFLAVAGGYWFILPTLPTGYEKIPDRYQKEVRNLGSERKNASVEGRGHGDVSGAASQSLPPSNLSLDLSSSLSSENELQALQDLGRLLLPTNPAGAPGFNESYRILAKSNDWLINYASRFHGRINLSEDEYTRIMRYRIGSEEFDRAIRACLAPMYVDMEKKMAAAENRNTRRVLTDLLQLPPLTRAGECIDELEHLPPFPISASPRETDLLKQISPMPLLHAALVATIRIPPGDPVKILKNLYGLKEYITRTPICGAPGESAFESVLLHHLALLWIRNDHLSTSTLRQLPREMDSLIRQSQEFREKHRDVLLLFRAQYARQIMLENFLNELDGRRGGGGMFHFFWLRTLQPVAIRQIDAFSCAIASGDIARMNQACDSLCRTLRMTDMVSSNAPRNFLDTFEQISEIDSYRTMIEFAVAAFRRERGGFPRGLHDLIPAFLDAPPSPFPDKDRQGWQNDLQSHTWFVHPSPQGAILVEVAISPPYHLQSRGHPMDDYIRAYSDWLFQLTGRRIGDEEYPKYREWLTKAVLSVKAWPLE